MNPTFKKVIHWMAAKLPAKKKLIQCGAMLPTPLRSQPLTRFLNLVVANTPGTFTLKTNLGLSSGFRAHLPSNTMGCYLFGTPEQHSNERGALFLAATLASDCDSFVDVGANHGYFTYFIASKLGKDFPICFFEPNAKLFEEISNTVKENRFNRISGFRKAVGDFTGTAKFFIDADHDETSSLKADYNPTSNTHSVEVPITTFDDFAALNQLTNIFLKVDIEGAELEFLKGAEKELHRVKYLILEILESGVKNEVAPKLIEKGLFAYYINDFCLEASSHGEFEYRSGQYNWFFCKLNPKELTQRLSGSKFTVKA